jgi:hypothetical protein
MANLNRFQDWQSRLDASLVEASHKSISYGTIDCCLFPANIILSITGTDLASNLRGKYKTELSAYRTMKRLFNGGIKETIEKIAEFNELIEINVNSAQRGDLVFVGDDKYCAPGIIGMSGTDIAIFPMKLVYIPIKFARKAWRI